MNKEKPDCYKCKYRGGIAGDAHSICHNLQANVVGDKYGRSRGWFSHPFNFDPAWLEKCDGFESKEEVE